MKKENLGLKKLRKQQGTEAKFFCDNCHCKRYSLCTCKRKENK